MSLLEFREVQEGDASQLLAWRTHPRVSALMATEFSGTEKTQRDWIAASRNRPDYYHWIIQSEGEDIGLVSIAQLDTEAHTVHWGFYVGNDDAVGKGSLIPAFLYNWLFNSLRIERVHTESFEDNTSVLKLHEMYGYRPFPERNRVVNKNGDERTLIALDLTKQDWEEQKRFHRYQADFPTSQWAAKPTWMR